MKKITYSSREEWLRGRLGRVTGSKLNDVFSIKEPTKDQIVAVLSRNHIKFNKGLKKEELSLLVPADCQSELIGARDVKVGFYEVLAERLAVPEEGGESPIDRGVRLEGVALQQFAKAAKKKVSNELVLWVSDDDEAMAYSPDGLISDKEVVEVKCLSSARHLMAYFEQEVPLEYVRQCLQGFIVNPKLKTCYVAFFDPRIESKPLHWITLTRDRLEGDIELYRRHELEIIAELDKKANLLSSY